MTKNIEYNQDDKTVLLERHSLGPVLGAMTDSIAPTRFEHLEERMVYAARLCSANTFNISPNALVAAASDLLSDVVRIKRGEISESLPDLNKRLTESLMLYEQRAQEHGAQKSEASSARYLLCTVLDEAVVITEQNKQSTQTEQSEQGTWSQMSLLSRLHSETFGGERFFQLLGRLSQDPVRNLPLLELMYLCLALGFEGKYRIIERGYLELDGIRDGLYRQICQLRGDVPRELSPRWEGLRDKRRRLVRIVPWWMVVLFTVVCLTVMYSGFAWVLSEQRETVLHPYQQLDPAVVQPQP